MKTGRIYLIGFMGSGKTSTGWRLAEKLDIPFCDLDEEIVARSGKSIPEIFSEEGEAAFREMEATILRETNKYQKAVIACGGGTPCHHRNMDWIIKNGLSIYLRTDPGLLAARLQQGKESRPLLSGMDDNELRAYIISKVRERESYYLRADIVFHQAEQDQEVAGELYENFKNIIGH